jgi:hypothetical protein
MSDAVALERVVGSRPVFVAAGGGGDAIAAVMASSWLQAPHPAAPAVAAFAWERKMFDPHPGPRTRDDFEGLVREGDDTWRITPRTRLTGGRSFLPRLAAESAADFYLLDPRGGGVQLRRQMAELLRLRDATGVVLVDVGGDILAQGDELWLKSPLADSLALAAAVDVGATAVLVLGLGLDGEVGERESRLILRDAARADAVTSLSVSPRSARRQLPLFEWHPSEVTGLACLAALGLRGRVELRRDGVEIMLDDDSASAHAFDYAYVLQRNRFALPLAETTAFDAADDVVRRTRGRTEVDFERAVVKTQPAGGWPESASPDLEALELELLGYSEGAAARGVQYLTLRRVGEVLGLGIHSFEWTRRWLRRRHPGRVMAPVWSCRDEEIEIMSDFTAALHRPT